jgi:hypothetical protein
LEIGHIFIGSAGNVISRSCGSGSLPQTGETKTHSVFHPNPVGLLAALGRLPFKEAIYRHDAAALR